MYSSIIFYRQAAANRKKLPSWIREGLEKMEREKQKALEREQQAKEREEAKKQLEEKARAAEEELRREGKLPPADPAKSRFVSNSLKTINVYSIFCALKSKLFCSHLIWTPTECKDT